MIFYFLFFQFHFFLSSPPSLHPTSSSSFSLAYRHTPTEWAWNRPDFFFFNFIRFPSVHSTYSSFVSLILHQIDEVIVGKGRVEIGTVEKNVVVPWTRSPLPSKETVPKINITFDSDMHLLELKLALKIFRKHKLNREGKKRMR